MSSKNRNYNLRYVKAQQFYGYESTAAVLTAMAGFLLDKQEEALGVDIDFNPDDLSWGGTVTWEDVNESA